MKRRRLFQALRHIRAVSETAVWHESHPFFKPFGNHELQKGSSRPCPLRKVKEKDTQSLKTVCPPRPRTMCLEIQFLAEGPLQVDPAISRSGHDSHK